MESTVMMKKCVFCAAGIAAIACTCKAILMAREHWKDLCLWGNNRTEKLSDAIKIEQLSALTKSSNVNLRRSSEQLLLEQVINTKSALEELVCWCCSKNEDTVLKGSTVICVLVKSVEIKMVEYLQKFLVTSGTVLVCSMSPESYYTKLSEDVTTRQKIQKLTLCTIFEMICDFAQPKEILCEKVPEFVPAVLSLLEHSRNREVMRYSLFITHQIALHTELRECIMRNDGIRRVALTVIIHQGDPIMQRVGLQVLVIFATTSGTDSKVVLSTMVKEDIIIPTVVCLKSDEAECIYWAVALLHEFAINDVCKEEIMCVPGFLRSLTKTLSASDSNQQRLILRLLCFLGLQNDGFKSEILDQPDILSRLPVCYASSDKEVVHWTLVLTHDLALVGKSAVKKLLAACENPSIVSGLVNLTKVLDTSDKRILAETLSCFCSYEHKVLSIIRQGVLATISDFASSGETDLQFWSSAVLLNMAMTSDDTKLELLKGGCLAILIDLAVSEHDNTQISTMAAKTLTMLGYMDKPLSLKVQCNADQGRVEIAEKTYHLDRQGLNILVWDKITSNSVQQLHFTVKNPWEIQEAELKIPCKVQDEGNIVVLVIRGVHNQAYLRAMKDLLLFSDNVQCAKATRLDVKPDNVCVLIGTLMSTGLVEIVHLEKDLSVLADFQFPYNEVVNHCVAETVLMNAIKVLFSTSPDSPISKVMELDLLQIFARHSTHKDLMLATDGFIQYLGSIIVQFVEKLASGETFPPILVAHCLGALRIVAVLSVHDMCREQLFGKHVIGAIVSLLFYLTGQWINAVLDSAAQQETSDNISPIPEIIPETDNFQSFTISDGEDSNEDEDFELFSVTPLPEPPNIRHQFDIPRTPSPSHIHKEMSESALLSGSPEPELQDKKPEVSDYEELYASLARYGIITLANCSGLFNSQTDQVACMNLIQAGGLHVLWSSLLCANAVLKNVVSLPLCCTLSRLACPMLPKTLPTTTTCLDVETKTSALLMSADRLQVRNDSWTFESVRANKGVGQVADDDDCLEGWYYEVTMKSGGIVQIGWMTEDCLFAPEKGLGVGDNPHSCAFDGGRCKVWNGAATEQEVYNNDYGMEWTDGDVISCLLHKNGDMSFWLRGVNMGTAFKGMDMSRPWYPAASLSTDQQIRFNFGSTNFRYSMPSGFVPLSVAAEAEDNRKSSEEHPFTSNTTYVRDVSRGLCDSEDDPHPQPSLYYEISISKDVVKPLVYGLSTMPDWRGKPNMVCCVIHKDVFELPNGQKLQIDTGSLAPQSLGCGLVMPEGAVFFTVNGRPLKTMFTFPEKHLGQDPLVPCTNNAHMDINFGETYFLYRIANERENRLSIAALLHDYHEIRCNAAETDQDS